MWLKTSRPVNLKWRQVSTCVLTPGAARRVQGSHEQHRQTAATRQDFTSTSQQHFHIPQQELATQTTK